MKAVRTALFSMSFPRRSNVASYYDDPEYKRNRKQVLEDYGWTCYRCRSELIQGSTDPRHIPTADHIIPTSHGGGHNIENLRAACKSCNSERGNRTEDLYRREWFDPTLLTHL